MKKNVVFTFLTMFCLCLNNAYSSTNQYNNCKYAVGVISWGNDKFFHYLCLTDGNNKAMFMRMPYDDLIVGQNNKNISNCQIIDRCFSKYETSKFNPSGRILVSKYGAKFSGLLPISNKITVFINREKNEETGEEPFVEFSINPNSINDHNGIMDVNLYIRRYIVGKNYDKSFTKSIYDFFDNHHTFKSFIKNFFGLSPYNFGEDAEIVFDEKETRYNNFSYQDYQ